ncbi:DUF1573 domain-containing protein [Flavobacterium sp. PLA-1-15]|uniref:DUF1573 domain-containing protein n=1 Tax=Flavobacterium sp. PLA-1-15 TaxID=3380533 RepID=UPI003B78E3C9
MKKGLLLFSAIALLSFSGSYAQESSKKVKTKAKTTTTTKTPVAKVTGPGIVFESETIDYGTVEYKSDGKREFVFTNNGTEPLIIKNAQGSCGCTVPTWPKEPIAPGAKAVIGVKYDTARGGQAFTKTITLTTNAANPTTTLTIKGNVLADPNAAKPAPAKS